MNNCPTPVNGNCGCDCPYPQIKIYNSFNDAVKSFQYICLKPGQMHPAYYIDNELDGELHCVVAVGSPSPKYDKLIISDTGVEKSFLQQLADANEKIDLNTENIDDLREKTNNFVTDASIRELFEKQSYISIIGSPRGTITADPSTNVEKGSIVKLTAAVEQGYAWGGWYNAGEFITDVSVYDVSVNDTIVNVIPVNSSVNVTKTGISAVFNKLYNVNVSTPDGISVNISAIDVNNTDKDLEDNAFDLGATLKMEISTDKPEYDINGFTVSISNQKDIANHDDFTWVQNPVTNKYDATVTHEGELHETMTQIFRNVGDSFDVSVNSTVVKFAISHECTDTTIDGKMYIDGNDKGYALRGADCAGGFRDLTGEEESRFEGWYKKVGDVETLITPNVEFTDQTIIADTTFIAKFRTNE